MKLSDYFPAAQIIKDGSFTTLGGDRTECANTLAYADTPYHLEKLAAVKNISCLITKAKLIDILDDSQIAIAISSSPRDSFYDLHEVFINEKYYPSIVVPGIGECCNIHPSAILSDYVHIEDGVTIGERVVIRDNVHICSGSVIEPGVIISAEGILYRNNDANNKCRIQHAGGVFIGTDVTLLANSVIARSVHPSISTKIGSRSIVGIATTIGHEAGIGENCVISGNSVVARNAIIEDGCYIGTGTVIRENIKLGKGATAFAGAIVVSDVAAGMKVSGNFAHSHFDRLRKHAAN